MAVISLTLYRTTVVNSTAQGNSTLVTIQIDDTNNDGTIDRTEWASYIGSPNGHVAGNTIPPALFAGNSGSTSNGTLYTPVSYKSGDGLSAILQALDKSKYSPTIANLNVCYLAGTLIATPTGQKPVETLQPGDLVLTRNNGPQPLVWAGSSWVRQDVLKQHPEKHPIRIKAGALGGGLPRRDVDLSPQHRVMVSDPTGREYMISARHLLRAGVPGVCLRPDTTEFLLVHIACADHQILLAEGAPMESFYTGKMAVWALSAAQLLGLIAAFPQVGLGNNTMTLARPVITHRDYVQMMPAAVPA